MASRSPPTTKKKVMIMTDNEPTARDIATIVDLLERSGIRLDMAADERDRPLVLKSLRRTQKKEN